MAPFYLIKSGVMVMQWGQMSGAMLAVQEFLEPVVESCGYDWWGCVWAQEGGRRILRVYIDSASGIGVDDCALVSRQVSPVLDVEMPDEGEYDLEVSSPGMERPFFTLEQSVPYVGQQVMVTAREAVEGKKRLRGTLVSVDADQVSLNMAGQEISVPAGSVNKFSLYPF